MPLLVSTAGSLARTAAADFANKAFFTSAINLLVRVRGKSLLHSSLLSAKRLTARAGCKLPKKCRRTWVMMNGQGVSLTAAQPAR